MAKSKESKGELFKTIIIAGAIALGFRSFLFEPFNIPSGSMVPTLLVGDYLFVSKYSYGYSRYSFPFGILPFEGRIAEDTPERGDVVVFRQPTDVSIAFIKRVVGLPGDRVQVKDGILHINGVQVKRTYLGKSTARSATSVVDFKVYEESFPNGTKHFIQERSDNDSLDNTVEFTVLADHYFMMGDNRDNSRDSRTSSVGMVPAENLIGKAQILFYSHDSSARIWEFWKWPFAIRYGRLGDTII
ncbi:signal peptidase I [Candidatus Puniceispirillum sp.]|jgi:signal peptidase I|uniref:signal peptidase I n=1 Tax=Candidatus Puniceispirillum sp. TaxID=2026719 RepID=UPI001EC9212F|nr:signal peptidase I [Candidatus Puniceispirillum sp.]